MCQIVEHCKRLFYLFNRWTNSRVSTFLGSCTTPVKYVASRSSYTSLSQIQLHVSDSTADRQRSEAESGGGLLSEVETSKAADVGKKREERVRFFSSEVETSKVVGYWARPGPGARTERSSLSGGGFRCFGKRGWISTDGSKDGGWLLGFRLIKGEGGEILHLRQAKNF
ncbi:unnamed protein product [Linum trigynum]|uniref:Uncharacterized protein n=1 Tax=Linum trigynum TaxID=586398 RepID=A0AAV2G850_9ROSI